MLKRANLNDDTDRDLDDEFYGKSTHLHPPPSYDEARDPQAERQPSQAEPNGPSTAEKAGVILVSIASSLQSILACTKGCRRTGNSQHLHCCKLEFQSDNPNAKVDPFCSRFRNSWSHSCRPSSSTS